MSTLLKATLRELPATEGAPPIGDAVDVQFNPTTLRVHISNRSAGGQQPGSQARQRPGTGEMTVNFDLIFDSVDEGTTTAPIPVTRKTMTVEKFVRPRGAAPNQQTPPRVEFRWGSFIVQGVMESANIDLDHFAADGTPLRAKVAVSIKGQNPEYRYDPILPAAVASSGNASGPPPGPNAPPAGSPGTQGGADTPRSIAQAMPGESLQQLAARHGLDPSAWRALANGIANPLSLSAGAEIALPSSLSFRAGVTGQRGGGTDPEQTTSSLPLVNNASLPNDSKASSGAGGSFDPIRNGQAVTLQGGVRGAISKVRGEAQRRALTTSQGGFGLATIAAQTASEESSVPRPYGSGVPLRPLRGDADDLLPVSTDPTVPRWEAMTVRIGVRVGPFNRIRSAYSSLAAQLWIGAEKRRR
jgi:hypothetical protein